MMRVNSLPTVFAVTVAGPFCFALAWSLSHLPKTSVQDAEGARPAVTVEKALESF
jgi:hypothetical protein